MTGSDTHYLAGIFDAKGRVYYAPAHRQLTVDICARRRALLLPFSERFGAGVTRSNAGAKCRGAGAWRWRITDRAALTFLREMRPHLRVRGEVAGVALLLDTMPTRLMDYRERCQLKKHLVEMQR